MTQSISATKTKTAAGIAAAIGFIAAIIIANWATTKLGFVSVGFGLTATAGTYAAGIALALRDATQDLLGRRAMFLILAVGIAVSYALSDPMIAVASAVAFGVSELLDFAVYTPLRRKSEVGDLRWAAAVGISGIVGAIADTAIFLGIAFGAAAILPALAGQLVGKTMANAAYIIFGKAVQKWAR